MSYRLSVLSCSCGRCWRAIEDGASSPLYRFPALRHSPLHYGVTIERATFQRVSIDHLHVCLLGVMIAWSFFIMPDRIVIHSCI